jgi:hypothetical protein
MTIKIDGVTYIECAKCGVYKEPGAFVGKKGRKRKSCDMCKSK